MEGLSEWLKQIVAVVLLAGLVDLLLPNRTMQRYVRLVAGLFILLTVAAPMLRWMQGDFGSKLAEQLDGISVNRYSAGAGELSRIESEGRKWRENRMKEAAGLVSAQLEEAIRADVERTERRRVEQVSVTLDQDEDGTIEVRDVYVELGAAEDKAEPIQDVAPVSEVRPVEPVTVDIQADSRPAAAEPSGGSRDDPADSAAGMADQQTRLRISAFISANYGVPADRVEVAVQRTDEKDGG